MQKKLFISLLAFSYPIHSYKTCYENLSLCDVYVNQILSQSSNDFLFYNKFWKVCEKPQEPPGGPQKEKLNFSQKFTCPYLKYANPNGTKLIVEVPFTQRKQHFKYEEISLSIIYAAIMELHMSENHDFVAPVNILTPFVHTLFS